MWHHRLAQATGRMPHPNESIPRPGEPGCNNGKQRNSEHKSHAKLLERGVKTPAVEICAAARGMIVQIRP
jgi:hypothetical protein